MVSPLQEFWLEQVEYTACPTIKDFARTKIQQGEVHFVCACSCGWECTYGGKVHGAPYHAPPKAFYTVTHTGGLNNESQDS